MGEIAKTYFSPVRLAHRRTTALKFTKKLFLKRESAEKFNVDLNKKTLLIIQHPLASELSEIIKSNIKFAESNKKNKFAKFNYCF